MPINPTQALTPTAQGSGDVVPVRSKNATQPTQGQVQPQPSPANNQIAADQADLSPQQAALPVAAQYVLSYHVDDRTQQLYFQVADEKSGEVIRQVPPQEVRAFEARLAEYLKNRTKSSEAPTRKSKGP